MSKWPKTVTKLDKTWQFRLGYNNTAKSCQQAYKLVAVLVKTLFLLLPFYHVTGVNNAAYTM